MARTVYRLLEEAGERFGNKPALYQPIPGDGARKYRIWSWAEYVSTVREIACGLRTLGIGRGDVVALDSETRAEFYLADLGVMANGSVSAALYTSYPTPELVRTLNVCGAKAVFVEDPKTLMSLQETIGPPIEAQWILLTGEAEGALTVEEVQQRGRAALSKDPELFERIQGAVDPNDPGILYMTSGATGEPKMALVSQSALVANMDHGPQMLPFGTEDRTLVFLPSAHIAQRVVMELAIIPIGLPVWFSESLARMPHEIREIQPTLFLAPPRVWERIYSSVCTEIRKKPAVTQKLFYGALGLGLEASRLRHEGKTPPRWMRSALKAADRLVFRKIRTRLGGKLRLAASGAAPLGRDLALFYEAIGMPLIEGYGLTEGGVVSMNPIDHPKLASIGKPMPGVEMKLADDGELLVRSPCLFSGYFNDPETTRAVLRDGWLYTGDIAEFDQDGYAYITGRKKELIVSSNGKKIYPARIESLFKTEPLINHVVLLGDRMPYVAALFTLNEAAAEVLKGMQDRGHSPAEIAGAPTVIAEVKKAVGRANQKLAPFEQIRKFRILEREFTIEDGELTPTMKVRRRQVIENFRSAISELYAGREEI